MNDHRSPGTDPIELLTDHYEEVKMDSLLEEGCPWNIPGKIGALGRSRIKLVNGRLNDEFRLSSSEDSRGDVLGSTSVDQLEIGDRIFNNWKELFQRMSQYELIEYGQREENYNLFILKPSSYGKSSFDSILQVFSMPIFDTDKHSMNINIKYTSESKRLIENMERAEKTDRLPYMLLADVYLGSEELNVIPVTAYYRNNTIENWTLE
jgi:hypothetical protein